MYSLEIRSGGQVTATWTLSGGWDVEALPPLSPGEPGTSATYTVAAYDLHGETISISGEAAHSIGYRLADGADEGILDVDRPAQELYGIGEIHLFRAAAGATEIELTLIQGGRVRQWTTPIGATVLE